MITAILLNKTNRLEETLNSINFNQIIVGSYDYYNNPKVEVIKLKRNNYSEDLNKLVSYCKNDYIFHIKEGEILLQSNLKNLENKVYGVQILKDDVVLKEARLWNKNLNIKFKNPVFETLDAKIDEIANMMIYQQEIKDPNLKEILNSWKGSDAYYYKSFISLAENNIKEFKSNISYYLFNVKKEDIAATMSRYYLALVQMVEKEYDLAIQNIVYCLGENILMAEFWCLLGDIFLINKNYEKAAEFYENAFILGNRRLKDDFWPIQLSKYNEYPTEMMKKCKDIINNSKKILINRI